MAAVVPIRLADYTPWAFSLPTVELDVDIQSDHVVVSSRLELQPQASSSPLLLRGVDLTIESLAIDDVPLAATDWSFKAGLLTIIKTPVQPFVLSTRCRIDPYNLSLIHI